MKMRKSLLIVTILLLGMSSCQQDDELIYSCDPVEDAWAKENLDDIRVMTRANWLEIDDSKKRVVYRAFSAEQKQDFWVEKIDKILLENQWEENESAHILLLKDSVKEHLNWFDAKGIEADEKTFDEFKIFAYQWLEYARNELKWDEFLIGAIVATGNDLVMENGKVKNSMLSSNRVILKKREEVCNCKTSNVVFTTCGPLSNSDCVSDSCDEIRDCGFILSETCDGICKFGGVI